MHFGISPLGIFAVKDAGEEYDTASVTAFYCYWVDSILDEYFMEDNNVTFQSTEFLVTTPPFIGTNWYEVKSHMMQIIATRIGAECIPL